MRLIRRSKKERRSESGNARPIIEVAEMNLSPDDQLFFDGADPKVLLKKTDERRSTPSAPAPDIFYRHLSKKKSQRSSASSVALEYTHTNSFRHVKPEDKLTNWGANLITKVCYENSPKYLDPSIENVRFVASPSPAPQAKKLLTERWPVESRRHCAARSRSQVTVETSCSQQVETHSSPPFWVSVKLPHSPVEVLAPVRPAKFTRRISYLNTLPVMKSSPNCSFRQQLKRKDGNPPSPPTSLATGLSIPNWLRSIDKGRSTTVTQLPIISSRRQESKRKIRRSGTLFEDVKLSNAQKPKKDPRPTPANPAQVATESPKYPLVQVVERQSPFRPILRVLMSIIHHILLTFNQFLPTWRILRDSKIDRDQSKDALSNVWLTIVYFVALWGLFTTVGKFVCFLAEGVNWVFGIVSLIMVLSLFSSCCLANG